MKPLIYLLATLGLLSCNQRADNTQLQNQVDSLETQLKDAYKPGFGEFMSSIQSHHAKLWFAGQNQNWKLADFEIHEILEAVANIQKYQTERPESEKVCMITPALDSMNSAIQQKDPALFKSCYIALTNNCNNCHRATEFEFNVVKIPETSPFSNQDFRGK